jgi:hypothetical protein
MRVLGRIQALFIVALLGALQQSAFATYTTHVRVRNNTTQAVTLIVWYDDTNHDYTGRGTHAGTFYPCGYNGNPNSHIYDVPQTRDPNTHFKVEWGFGIEAYGSATNVMYMENGKWEYTGSADGSTPWFQPFSTISVGSGADVYERPMEDYPDSTCPNGCSSFTISRTGDTNSNLQVYFHYANAPSGTTPVSGTDYVNEDTSGNRTSGNVWSSIMIPAGYFSVELPIVALYDEAVEGLEIIRVVIDTDSVYAVAASCYSTLSGVGDMYIQDDD